MLRELFLVAVGAILTLAIIGWLAIPDRPEGWR